MHNARLREYHPELGYDLLFVLDCNSYSRVGARKSLIDKAACTILIDHHVPENGLIQADYSFIDPDYVSVGAILYRTFQEEINALPPKSRIPIANCLYVTILNDTNNFTNANTTAEVFATAAGLAGLGIQPHALHKAYFLNHSPLEMRYVGESLSTIELHHQNRILFMHSTVEMAERNHLRPEEIMSITRWVQGVRGVDVIVHFREERPNLFKLSFRSVKLDVNRIAVRLGGGGHKNASGAHISGSLDQVKQAMLSELTQALDNQHSNA